ncbi:hypothetical protein GCM10009616_07110 [Microlunatus lacustris]
MPEVPLELGVLGGAEAVDDVAAGGAVDVAHEAPLSVAVWPVVGRPAGSAPDPTITPGPLRDPGRRGGGQEAGSRTVSMM